MPVPEVNQKAGPVIAPTGTVLVPLSPLMSMHTSQLQFGLTEWNDWQAGPEKNQKTKKPKPKTCVTQAGIWAQEWPTENKEMHMIRARALWG